MSDDATTPATGPDDERVDQQVGQHGAEQADRQRDQEDREQAHPQDDEADRPRAAVEQPGKVMRIGTMIRHLLEEVRSAPLDSDARERLVAIHEASVHELEQALSPELAAELRRFSLPFDDGDGDDATPTDAELRIAQAQLVGWLEGLFHGIQTAIAAQQVQIAQAQAAAQAGRQLPPGAVPGGPGAGLGPGAAPGQPDSRPHPGQYL